MYKIYKHSDIKGFSYIGLTKRGVEERFKEHVRDALTGSKLDFHKGIREYGPDGFTTEIIHDDIQTLTEANELESYYIKLNNTYFGEGYNMTMGGDAVKKATFESKVDIDKLQKCLDINTVRKASELYGVSNVTLYNIIRKHNLSTITDYYCIKIDTKELQEILLTASPLQASKIMGIGVDNIYKSIKDNDLKVPISYNKTDIDIKYLQEKLRINSVYEVAKMMKVTPCTIYSRIKDHNLIIGKPWKKEIDKDKLQNLLLSNTPHKVAEELNVDVSSIYLRIKEFNLQTPVLGKKEISKDRLQNLLKSMNKTKASKELGVSITVVTNRIKEFKLTEYHKGKSVEISNDEIINHLRKGLNMREIAKVCDVDRGVIQYRVKKHNLKKGIKCQNV